MSGVRERARAATTAEILRLAREQMAVDGAAALSLRAVARELGMVSSAVYRYFASRDELLTALIIDSYDRLGAAVEQGDGSVTRRDDFLGRYRAATWALREWAVEHPSEWALLFGTPVPGYKAPQDTIPSATRYAAVLVGILADMSAAGLHHVADVPMALRPDLKRLRDQLGSDTSDGSLAVGLASWAALMGAINLELFGHLNNVVDRPGALYDAVVEQHGAIIMGTAVAREPS